MQAAGRRHGTGDCEKRGYLSLPSRAVGRAAEEQLSDPSSRDVTTYLRSMPGRARSERYRARSEARWAPPARRRLQAPDGDLLKAIGTKPQRFTIWLQFEQTYRGLASAGFLSYAVRGFFENGGNLCYVQLISYPPPDEPQDVSLALTTALEAGLATLATYDDYDLVCVPDLMWESAIRRDPQEAARLQDLVMAHCAQLGERMAILDSVLGGEKSAAVSLHIVTCSAERRARSTIPGCACRAGRKRPVGTCPPAATSPASTPAPTSVSASTRPRLTRSWKAS